MERILLYVLMRQNKSNIDIVAVTTIRIYFWSFITDV